MGMFTRALVPRGVRRAMHPARTAKSAMTPKTVKRARRALSPVDNAAYSIERKLNTKPRTKGSRSTKATEMTLASAESTVTFDLDEIAQWFERGVRENGGVAAGVVCEPDPENPWIVIATGTTQDDDGHPGIVRAWIQCAPDGTVTVVDFKCW